MARLSKLAFHPVALLLAAVFACHVLLPFTDYRIQGDRWLMNWVAGKHFDYLNTIYSETGRSATGWYFGLFSLLPDIPTTCKVLGFVLCAATGLLAYTIALRTRFVTRLEALVVAVVAVTFPADKLIGGLMYSKSQGCTCAFLLGVLLVLCAEQRSGLRHWMFRLAAVLPFFFSFLVESHLLFFGGFLWLLVLLRQRQLGLPWYRIPWGYCLRRADLLALPIIYWTALTTLNPPHGPYYDGWHRFHLSDLAALFGRLSSYQTLASVVLAPVVVLSSYSAWCLVALACLVLLTAVVVAAAARHISRQEETHRRTAEESVGQAGGVATGRWLGLLLFGLVLLFLGTFPYIALGGSFVPWGDDRTRYACLAPLSFGVILVAVGRAVLRPRSSWLRLGLSHAVSLVLAGLLVAWGVTWWDNYLSLQAVQIRDDAIVRKVHGSPEARDCSVYCVLNQYPIPRTIDDLNTWEWTYAETGVSGEPRSIAFMAHPFCRPLTAQEVKDFIWISTIPYALTSIDVCGKQGLVIIEKGADYRFPKGVFTYLYLKYCAPKRVGEFLDRAVNVQFVPAPWGTAAADRLRSNNP